jgi:hypothetical protein
MKKYLILIVLVLLAIIAPPAQAQTIGLVSTTNSLKLDTVTNAGVRVMQTQLTGNKATVTIQVDVTKISGTLGGTIIPVGSNDGVKWYAAGSGTFTVTDVASQGVNFSPPLGFGYYGVQWTGTGTMSGSIKATLLARTPYQ